MVSFRTRFERPLFARAHRLKCRLTAANPPKAPVSNPPTIPIKLALFDGPPGRVAAKGAAGAAAACAASSAGDTFFIASELAHELLLDLGNE